MPRLEEFQLNLREEATKLNQYVHNGDLEEAESTAYFLYKRLSELNGNEPQA